jgi:hypothetical protein
MLVGHERIGSYQTPAGQLHNRSPVLGLRKLASKVLATVLGRANQMHQTHNEYQPPSRLQTANTGPPYRLHSYHRADVYLRTSEALAAAREQGVNRAAKPVNSGSPFSRP